MKSVPEEILLNMFLLEILLTLLLPSADSLMVTMQVFLNPCKLMFQTESLSNHCFQPNGSFPDDPSYVQWRNRFLLPEFSVSVCIRWKLFLHFVEIRWTMTITSINLDTNRLFTQLRNSLNLTNNETGFASMRSGGWEIGCSATACLLTMTSWTYVRKSPYIWRRKEIRWNIKNEETFWGIFSQTWITRRGWWFSAWVAREALKIVSKFLSSLTNWGTL